jgi:hypothetical protein
LSLPDTWEEKQLKIFPLKKIMQDSGYRVPVALSMPDTWEEK